MRLLVNIVAYIVGFGVTVLCSFLLLSALEKAGAGTVIKAVTISVISMVCNSLVEVVLQKLHTKETDNVTGKV